MRTEGSKWLPQNSSVGWRVRQALAKKKSPSGARISLSLLYQLGPHGYRNASSGIWRGAGRDSQRRRVLTRADMNETCNGCKYFFKECQEMNALLKHQILNASRGRGSPQAAAPSLAAVLTDTPCPRMT